MYVVVHLFVMSFFFYSYCAHRDLHSFPTRRSSDLKNPVRQFLGRALMKLGLLYMSDKKITQIDDEMRRRKVGKDRKSTRLNSSHANISYAVFCLKKKRKIFEN